MYKTITREVDIEIDLADFDTDDLLDELRSRHAFDWNEKEYLEIIYHKLRLGQNYDKELADLIYNTLGRIV